MIVNNDSDRTVGQTIQDPSHKRLAAGHTRGFWTRELHRWHWISSAVSLIGLLLFTITGFTLNHAGDIAGEPVRAERTTMLEGGALEAVQRPVDDGAKAPLPAPARHAIEQAFDIALADEIGEWSDYDIFLAMPRPGGDATLTIDRETGEALYSTTDYGWIAWFNDLHKGRHTGTAWSWFIDLFAAACLVFSITGLVLLQIHARSRPSTWPLVGFGLLLPVLLILLFVHR